MALGGGTFTQQNKVLPGSYINVKSSGQSVVNIGERGVVAMPTALTWAPSGVFTVTAEEFTKNSMDIFGYAYTAPEMEKFREVFKHAQTVHVYNLNDQAGVAASNFWATAKNKGTRGNALKVVIQANVDNEDLFDVSLYMENTVVFTQTAATGAELENNPYVTWQTGALTLDAGSALSGGTDGNTTAASYQNALNAFEPCAFNVIIAPYSESYTPLFSAYTKRMREDHGVKFQMLAVAFDDDYEGVISIPAEQANARYWAAGALAGCAINRSCTNMKYDGELEITCTHTRAELEDFIKTGVFAFHKVEDDVRVLMDINTRTTFTDEKNADFAHNQTVRVTDNINNDIKRIFNTKYLGNVQNDAPGRASLWGDEVQLLNQYAQMRAIEPFDSKTLTVNMGNTPNSVVSNFAIKIIGAMEKLYQTVICN